MQESGIKTRFFVLLVVVSNVLGNSLLSLGMRGAGGAALSPAFYLNAFLNPVVAAGVGVLILNLLSLAALMSWADLSFVVPVTAAGYVLTAVAGLVFMQEHIPAVHWLGIVLIAGGAGLVSRTSPAMSR